MRNIIIKYLRGIFNVSNDKKIYLNDMVFWLNKFNKKKILLKKNKIKNDCFFLNNKKLMSKIKIENSKRELKEYCLKISKKKFS